MCALYETENINTLNRDFIINNCHKHIGVMVKVIDSRGLHDRDGEIETPITALFVIKNGNNIHDQTLFVTSEFTNHSNICVPSNLLKDIDIQQKNIQNTSDITVNELLLQMLQRIVKIESKINLN